MTVIALVGNKGGAGKTTIAVNLARALGQNAATALLDADPQGSALQWRAIAERAEGPDVYDASEDLEGLVDEVTPRYEHVVIDCPPSVHAPQTHAALNVSGLALVPVQPSPVDLWATVHIARAIQTARGHNLRLDALLVINQLVAELRNQAAGFLFVPGSQAVTKRLFQLAVFEKPGTGLGMERFNLIGAAMAF